MFKIFRTKEKGLITNQDEEEPPETPDEYTEKAFKMLIVIKDYLEKIGNENAETFLSGEEYWDMEDGIIEEMMDEESEDIIIDRAIANLFGCLPKGVELPRMTIQRLRKEMRDILEGKDSIQAIATNLKINNGGENED